MIQTIFKHMEIQAVEDNKVLGRLKYSLVGKEMSILHTYSYASGRGIGAQLVRAALQWATAHRYTIIPICSFAQKYLIANSQHKSLNS
jgi:predicted GNAT family acetyltransferase